MKNASLSATGKTDFSALSKAELIEMCARFQQQLDWFKRQLFGEKSEKRNFEAVPQQINMAAFFQDAVPALPESPKQTVTYQRGTAKKQSLDNAVTDAGLRFDERVPVEEIHLTPPELQGPDKDQYIIVDTHIRYRLAQKPGAYVVLKYLSPVIKHKPSQTLTTAAVPANVLDKSLADVSLLAGLMIDKFCYHLPLYRQHQRLEHSGIKLARSSLTTWVKRAIDLLRPIYDQQLAQILQSKILAIDETPIKAGREKKGKLKQGYFWPIFGEAEEICFTFATSRAQKHLFSQLGDFKGTLLSDGYSAYHRYTQTTQATHAQCWVHTRRYFEQALEHEPKGGATALDYIGALYHQEKQIREQGLEANAKRNHRQEHSRPLVDAFFTWVYEQRQRPDLLPMDPFLTALNYAHQRELALRTFLDDPQVPLDTNHLERALRVIPMGRKNWLFAWTEVGAEQIGIIQSLLVTCRLHLVNPYDYLVDVLQRVDRHPARQIEELTPRFWKQRFAQNLLRSDVFRGVKAG